MTRFMHAAVALFMAASVAVTPLYAQGQNQDQNNAPAPAQPGSAAAAPAAPAGAQPRMQTPPPQYQPPSETQGPPPAPARTVQLGPHNFSRPWFPDVIAPYQGVHVAEPMLTNTPKIDQLIQNGKLMLSLEDAISLGLENNLGIVVERYAPMLDEANLLLAQSGRNGLVPFDSTFTSSFNIEESTTPVNNPLFVGAISTGVTGVQFTPPIPYTTHAINENFGYTQYFPTGTELQVTFNNGWESQPINLSFDLLNPYYQSTLSFEVTQPLLNGFGKLPNTRYIIEAKNTIKIGQSQFRNQVISAVTTIATDYWELVYARENVKVEQVTVAADQQLYENNKKQEQIGTMAPLDVIDAQSQLATDQQALVQSQTVQLLDQTNLLVAITKDPLAEPLQGAEIVPTTPIFNPTTVDTSLPDAVKIAMQNRPEIEQAELTLKNDAVEISATKNGLRPTLNLFGLYEQQGLGGVENVCTANCAFGAAGPKTTVPFPVGLGYDLQTMIQGNYPTYEAGLNLTLPIRNRAAQAAYATAEINQRQELATYMQTRATIIQGVRQALITLEQDRAAVAAAQEARIYNQQSYDDEVKKLQLGTSTAFTVVQKQQLLTVAEGTELRDRINLIEAELNYQQALGTTLDVHNISIQGVQAGKTQPLNIPGTPDKTMP